ncbi:MAG: hypothetical protein [Inoviridae sp.]|nr:MAG: hypothetical protein [Inoviridae sp.]
MLIQGTLVDFTKTFNGRPQFSVLTSHPADLIQIQVDENQELDHSMAGKIVEVAVKVSAYKDNPQFRAHNLPRVLASTSTPSPKA